ncbi:PHP domain-containing protein [Candidatus Poribacteria bacterium]
MSSSRGLNNPDELLNWAAQHPSQTPIPSNLHIHTPYSFSAFTDIKEAVSLARRQGVRVLGISDFNTTEGYGDFSAECQKAGILPLFCMETIALSVQDRDSGRRWNDPSNPGRIYFCGKGLRYPAQFSQHTQDTLSQAAQALEHRVREMMDRLNRHLGKTAPGIQLGYDHICATMTEGTVRERHLAKALQQALDKEFPGAAEKSKALKALYGSESQVDVTDEVALQNELRSNLLKAGKVAFVEERQEAFLNLAGARSLILDMGGIPCYPVLAAGSRDDFTEVERDPENLCDELFRRGIHCAEFIPTRNDIDTVREYVSVFKERGVILTAGTEHNTPRMEPMIPVCRGEVELDEALKEAFWKGACVVAAHQYLTGIGRAGYIDHQGNRTDEGIEQLEAVGKAVIAYYLANPNHHTDVRD